MRLSSIYWKVSRKHRISDGGVPGLTVSVCTRFGTINQRLNLTDEGEGKKGILLRFSKSFRNNYPTRKETELGIRDITFFFAQLPNAEKYEIALFLGNEI